MEEGGGEWFDALGEIEPPTEDVGDEKVHSRATEVLSEGNAGVIKEGPEMDAEMEVEKHGEQAREEEIVQQVQPEEFELNPTTEVPEDAEAETNPTEQEVEGDPAMEVGTSPAASEVGVNPAEGVEIFPAEGVETNFAEARREEVVVVTDDEEDVEKELPRETTRQEVGGHEESPARSVAGASRRRMRHLIDEATEEEEDDTIFQPNRGPRIQRRPVDSARSLV